jgi:hypothetical protein
MVGDGFATRDGCEMAAPGRVTMFKRYERTGFSVVVKSRGKSPNPWRREIYRAGGSSGCSTTKCLTRSLRRDNRATIRMSRYKILVRRKRISLIPPNLAGLRLPVLRRSLRKRTTELMLTPSRSAFSGIVAPSCAAPITRSRRSSECGFPISCWPAFQCNS